MMQLKLLEVQELAHLQMQLINITDEIEKLTDLCMQLANDRCAVNISFIICNETKADEARAKKERDEMMMDPMEKMARDYYKDARRYMGGIASVIGYDINPRPGNIERSFKFSEADALRVMSVIIENKKLERREIIAKMRRITKNHMAAIMFLDESNPVKE